jgi:hypothetical protein
MVKTFFENLFFIIVYYFYQFNFLVCLILISIYFFNINEINFIKTSNKIIITNFYILNVFILFYMYC